MHKALRANAPLSYPQLVTLFLHHFQIPLDGEPFVQVKISFAIGDGAVTSFGYRKDIDGQWIRKQDLPPPIPDERTSSPLPQRDASSTLMHEVLSELRGLRAFVGDCLDAMDPHFKGMDTWITQLEDDIGFICRCFNPPAAP